MGIQLKRKDWGKTYNKKQLGTVITIHSQKARNVDTTVPAMFPIKLPAEHIIAMTNENDNVIDCFGGSGSTLIACEQLNRICYMMELDPRYCDVIRKRYNNYIENNK